MFLRRGAGQRKHCGPGLAVAAQASSLWSEAHGEARGEVPREKPPEQVLNHEQEEPTEKSWKECCRRGTDQTMASVVMSVPPTPTLPGYRRAGKASLGACTPPQGTAHHRPPAHPS